MQNEMQRCSLQRYIQWWGGEGEDRKEYPVIEEWLNKAYAAIRG